MNKQSHFFWVLPRIVATLHPPPRLRRHPTPQIQGKEVKVVTMTPELCVPVSEAGWQHLLACDEEEVRSWCILLVPDTLWAPDKCHVLILLSLITLSYWVDLNTASQWDLLIKLLNGWQCGRMRAVCQGLLLTLSAFVDLQLCFCLWEGSFFSFLLWSWSPFSATEICQSF